ncbi:GNAT family N-acetyltransferase [Actinoplanes sp. DH11]|uniref:GNAT family N-acetyltransferase n=1 Tax=Actinoplanes sp. DH11 TaxID=2857011 RepID=UPI001E413D00|nr:GNAT family N-acetyltransferase [Actinoplanes sp. DH11]
MSDLTARLACVGRTWTPQQRLHPGNVAWSHARGDGSTTPDAVLTWGDPLFGFADIWRPPTASPHPAPSTASVHPAPSTASLHPAPSTVSLHLAPESATARRMHEAVDELLQVAPHATVEVSLQQPALLAVLTAKGFRRDPGPWFTHLWRELTGPLPRREAAGYRIRPVRDGELADRVEVHRHCWAPARIRHLLGLPVTGGEPASGYSAAKHTAVTASPLYRAELDLVAEAPDGSLAGYALGWLDPQSRSVLFEPVGTVPAHARRGLATALCTELLRVAHDLGATQATVGPRGDADYPVARRLYQGLHMRETTQVVPFSRVPAAHPDPAPRHP